MADGTEAVTREEEEAARPFALEAEEPGFLHSLAMWLADPQNKQSLLSNRRLRSAEVSLLSFPSLSERSGRRGVVRVGAGAEEEVDGLNAGTFFVSVG